MSYRILIVGLGSIGQRHLRLARKLFPQAEIAVLRHKHSQLVPELADFTFDSLQEAMAFSPKFAVIANPATLHLQVSVPLARAGVHLMIEKPLSASVYGIEELLSISRRSGSTVVTGYNLRYVPSLRKFKSFLDEGLIGKVWSVRCEAGQYLPSWRVGADYRLGVSAQNSLGGGALLELSHEIDYLCWIFGKVDWVHASLTKQSDLEIDVEDTAHLIMGFSADSDNYCLVAGVSLDFIRQDTTRLCTVVGEHGSLQWNGKTGLVELYAQGADEWEELYRYQGPSDESFLAEWKNFISCIEDDAAPGVNGEDGLRVLQVVEAARLAAKTGNRVKVEYANVLPECKKG